MRKLHLQMQPKQHMFLNLNEQFLTDKDPQVHVTRSLLQHISTCHV